MSLLVIGAVESWMEARFSADRKEVGVGGEI